MESQHQREQVNAFTSALARATGESEIAEMLVGQVVGLIGLDFVGLAVVEGEDVRGLLARRGGRMLEWWPDTRVSLADETSALARSIVGAAPVVIEDVAASSHVNRRIADAVGAKSAAFVPAVTSNGVIASLAVATTNERRAFSKADLALLQELATETAIALERARSSAALDDALERERLVASIARRVRSELDLDEVLRVVVEEVGRAVGCSRCFVRLGDDEDAPQILAEWDGPGFAPVGERVERLPLLNLAVREGRTIAAGDVLDVGERERNLIGNVDVLLELGTRAVVAAPIRVFDTTIGALVLHRSQPTAWSEAEAALVEAVASEVGVAVHIARLLRENERRIAQDAALLKAARVVSSELDSAVVLQRLVDEVCALLGGDGADCYLVDAEHRVLRCAAVCGLPDSLVGSELPLDLGISGEAVATRRSIVAPDYTSLAADVPNPVYGRFAHAIVAPVLWSGEVRAVLGVGSDPGGRVFSASDAEVLETFAGLAALALRNAEAFEERARQAGVERGFYRIASALGQSLSLADTVSAVSQAASDALGGDFAAVLLPHGVRLELAGSHHLPEPLEEALSDGLQPEEAALLAAAAARRPLASTDVVNDDRFEAYWRAVAVRARYRSLLAVPVSVPDEERTAGLVLVFFAEERRFADDDLELAAQLASAAHGALERSARFERERRARALAQQLARTGSLLATTLDPAAVLDEVVDQAPALLGVDACAIRVLEGNELVVIAAVGEGAEAALGSSSPATGRLSGEVAQSRAPLTVEDAASDERVLRADRLLELGYRAYLGVPLTGPEGSVHGVLAVYTLRAKAWREEEVEALLALAGNASAALATAELYQRVTIAKEQADAILANIADGIVAVDREGRVVLWNRAAEEITAVAASDALGRTPRELLGRELEPDRRGRQGEVSILRGGEEIRLSLTEAVMQDPAGAVAGRIFAIRDVSAERFVEQLKTDFVSTVSQELRRPLASIYGFAETLLRSDTAFGEDERRTFLRYIAGESERLTAIVDALVSVARLESGDLDVSLTPTDIGEVVSELVASAAGAAGSEDHRLVADVPEGPVLALADPARLRQAVGQLLDNAVKFSPAGGTVTVGARVENGSVEIDVVDEGIGIPALEQERIFHKFYTGDDPRAGTGLGLFIARGLVAAMGGRLGVESVEGKGSSFRVELPVAGGRDPQANPSEERAQPTSP